MSDVSKHHAKEEGESYGKHDCGVELLVAGNSVGVNNFLEKSCKNIGLDICGWSIVEVVYYVQFSVRQVVDPENGVELTKYQIKLALLDPYIGCEQISLHLELAHVQEDVLLNDQIGVSFFESVKSFCLEYFFHLLPHLGFTHFLNVNAFVIFLLQGS